MVAEGRLLALMAACKLKKVLLLQPGSGALVVEQDAATPSHIWHNSSPSALAAAGSAADTAAATAAAMFPADMTGCQLVRQLMSRTCVELPQQCCCAVSFWAGYMVEVKPLGRWCAGEHTAQLKQAQHQ